MVAVLPFVSPLPITDFPWTFNVHDAIESEHKQQKQSQVRSGFHYVLGKSVRVHREYATQC